MTAIAGILGRGSADPGRDVAALLAAMQHRGDVHAGAAAFSCGALGAMQFAWEDAPGIGAARSVVTHEGVVVAADATLYYLADLRRRLGHHAPRVASPDAATWILAAYRLLGERCAAILEGDFAFLVLDSSRGTLLAARDHVGRRPLHYSIQGDQVVAGSLARAVASHVGAPLNLPAIAAAVGALLGGSTETGFVDVLPVLAGSTLLFQNSRVRVVDHWTPRAFRVSGKPNLAAGAAELRELLVEAVRERTVGPVTAVWLSGGMDSQAVFGAGQADPTVGQMLRPVSITYPEGDPAREDEHIRTTAELWAAPISWIDSESIDLFADLPNRVAVRDDPYAHTFEAVNRRLAQTTLGIGARVAFDGYGGDQLFHVSDAFLADLLARGNWRDLRRARVALGLRSFRSLVSTSVFPWLPERLLNELNRFRGRGPGHAATVGKDIPSWLAPVWAADHRILERVALEPARRLLESPSQYEARWYMETPYFPRASAWAAGLARQVGVDVRSPLLDRRIIEFVSSRPLRERAGLGESKVLLREAVRGLVPESVLAPRPFKTGIPRGYLHRQMKSAYAGHFERACGSGAGMRLAELGIVTPAALAAAVQKYGENIEHRSGVQLILTLQAELWIRSVESGQKGRTTAAHGLG